MKRFSWVILFLLFIQNSIAQLNHFSINGLTQGTTYSISYYHKESIISKNAIDSILSDLDQSMSNYNPKSLLSNFNNLNVNEIQVDPYLNDVLAHSFKIHKESKGIFDLTISPLVGLWGFGPNKNLTFPDSLIINKTLEKVGMDKLNYRRGVLKKKIKGVTIDVNGIAQGYSVDVLANYLSKLGVENFMVEIGGEIKVKGVKPNNEKFKIAIQRPNKKDGESDYIVSLTNRAITTSGNYEQFREYKGKKIAHHINPKTGYPFEGSIISVTVIAETAMEADALDNVLIPMNPLSAINFANARKKIDIYLVYDDQGVVKEAYSKGFLNYISPSQYK